VPSASQAGFSLIDAARITGVHPEMILYYWRLGLLDAQRDLRAGMLTFDRGALEEIRHIEHYRRHLGVNRRALPLVCQLRRKCESLQIELFFLRSPQAALSGIGRT